jgi:hypothetical protein
MTTAARPANPASTPAPSMPAMIAKETDGTRARAAGLGRAPAVVFASASLHSARVPCILLAVLMPLLDSSRPGSTGVVLAYG